MTILQECSAKNYVDITAYKEQRRRVNKLQNDSAKMRRFKIQGLTIWEVTGNN